MSTTQQKGISAVAAGVEHRCAADADAILKARLKAYLANQLGRPVELSAWKRYPSGFSWITYGFSIDPPGIDGITEIILRLGPRNGLFAPYSAEPQYQALAAMDRSDVPAPRAFFWSDDPSILGDPFFLSERAAGEAPIPWVPDGGLSEGHRRRLGEQFADILGSLHTANWRATGLAKFGVGVEPGNAAEIQVDSWEAQYRRRRLRSEPMLHLAFAWLRAHLPRAEHLCIVHGDYRLGNFLEVDGSITAILDWELVHIGDPHEDLAWVCLPQYRGGSALMSKLISREELYSRYQARTGFPVNETAMRYYTVFCLVKLVVTHCAAVFAFEGGGFHDLRMAAMGTQIAPTLRQIEKILEKSG